jgi:hypothetical protein
MQLLDLPPEISAEIIHAYLGDVSWPEAAKARYVCKTFAAAIYDDMFGRYSANYYNRTWKHTREGLLEPNMHTILFKMSSPRCTSSYLLDHINATIEFLMGFSYYQTQAVRERYRLALCNAISTSHSVNHMLLYLCVGPYSNSVTVRTNISRSDTFGMLAAAAAVNSLPALRFLVGKVRDTSLSSEVYGTPPTAAATNGNLEAATFLCEYMNDTTSVRQYLHNTISTCTSKPRRIDGPTLAWLMHWYLERCTKSRTIETKNSQMIDWAIRTGDIDVLRLCYTRDQIPIWGCILSSYEFLLACEYGHVLIVQFFLEYVPCPKEPQHTCQAGRGLCAAARGGWVRACKVLLNHDGACVNSRSGVENAPALYWAVERGNVDLVVLLLAYGAKVMRDKERQRVSM